ncbi:unnamed protein product [Cylicocyclus nassatus]|uniref:Uncharacterized protein n=1 Tax=Cylicocyclus nassatus TaxID=53992 RepID=A0AA36GU93_CYLNA|nr:unnamed protein product [Cylicocyclus nassatus]
MKLKFENIGENTERHRLQTNYKGSRAKDEKRYIRLFFQEMMKLLIAILYLASAASNSNMSEVSNFTKTDMELPLFKANMFAMKAFLKVWWFTAELMGEDILYSFSREERAVLEKIVSTIKLRSEEEFFAELIKKSADLGARVKNMFDLRKKQLAELKPEAQAFVENITEFMWNSKFLDEYKALPDSAADEFTLGFVEKFNALSDDVKENIKEKIPALAAFLTSEEATKRLQEH